MHDRAEVAAQACAQGKHLPAFQAAGPRQKIFFDPSEARAAIVTCGGLCPGINNVIRTLVMELYYRYGVHAILGIRYGYRGFIPKYGYEPVPLDPRHGEEHPRAGRQLPLLLPGRAGHGRDRGLPRGKGDLAPLHHRGRRHPARRPGDRTRR